jgi:hypothetical protein
MLPARQTARILLPPAGLRAVPQARSIQWGDLRGEGLESYAREAGASRRKGGATNSTSNQRLRKLSPRFGTVRDSKLSRAPKRDHDEWLVRWMVGWFGSRSGPGLKYLGMGHFGGQAAVNARDVRCRAFQGARPPCIRRLEEVGNAGSPGLPGRPRSTAMRHGMLPSPGTISPKPRSAGEARASYCLRTTRVGAIASPAPLHYPSTRGGNAGGRFATP